jgi:hypothetical protein
VGGFSISDSLLKLLWHPTPQHPCLPSIKNMDNIEKIGMFNFQKYIQIYLNVPMFEVNKQTQTYLLSYYL